MNVILFGVPRYVTTTGQIGRAMIHVARHGALMKVIETRDMHALR